MGDILTIAGLAAAVASLVSTLLTSIKAQKELRVLMRRTVELQMEAIRHFLEPWWIPDKLVRLLAGATMSVSAGLLLAVHDAMRRATLKNESREARLTATVAGMMVRSKAAANARAYAFLVAAIIVYVCIVLFADQNLTLFPVTCLSLLVICVYVNQRVLEYRIRNGFYGLNAYEAKEIISFILSHSETSEFSDSDGLKAILPDADMESTYERLHGILPEYVQ